MYNIVTSIAVDQDKKGKNINYPMLGNQQGEKRNIYWRCVVSFCITAKHLNPKANVLVYTNDTHEINIEGFDVRAEFSKRGIIIKYLPFKKFDPDPHSKSYRNAFYKLEVIDALGLEELPSILVDSDCLWTKYDSNFIQALSKPNTLILQDTYQRNSRPESRNPHNLSMKEMGELYNQFGLFENNPVYPIWFGGELIGSTPQVFALLGERLFQTMEYCKDKIDSGGNLTFKNGRSIFDNDEFISSYVFNSLEKVKILDSFGIYSRRIFTSLEHNNVRNKDLDLLIWHLPDAKMNGLRLVYDDLINPQSEFFKLKDGEHAEYLGKHVGIPKVAMSLDQSLIIALRKIKRSLRKVIKF